MDALDRELGLGQNTKFENNDTIFKKYLQEHSLQNPLYYPINFTTK